jgi:NAD(P)-dependent dehydrogenase (short-subunit alcohol dehydrogenase family)
MAYLGLKAVPTDRVILITGTSTGFGRAAAETLARRGYTVFAGMRDIAGRNASSRRDLQTLAQEERLRLEVLDMDVTQDASVTRAVELALDRAGCIDVVINNAGIAGVGLTEAYTVEQIREVLDVNLFGAVRVNRAVLPAMRKQRSGLLIHVSSGAGRIALPYMAAYSASKFALEAVADAYRFELSPFGIDSVVVEPGTHRTPILTRLNQPADQVRVAEYGESGEYAQRVRSYHEQAAGAAETPGVEEVVQAFVELIETPPGERQFRTVPTVALRPLLQPYNAAAVELRQAAAQVLDVTELLHIRSADRPRH